MQMVEASATAGNKQIHEDLNVQFFVKHIGILTESFEYKLAVAGKSLDRLLCLLRTDQSVESLVKGEWTWQAYVGDLEKGGQIDTTNCALHFFHLPRFLVFLSKR
jgi:hypothetical protein